MNEYINANELKIELNNRIELLENGDAHPEVMKRVEGIIKGYKTALSIIDSLQQEQPETGKYDCPTTPIEEAVEVTSRMQHIDEEMKPIAKFIMDYASWNLHKDECNQPVIEVPLFRVLDALVQRGKPYCCAG